MFCLSRNISREKNKGTMKICRFIWSAIYLSSVQTCGGCNEWRGRYFRAFASLFLSQLIVNKFDTAIFLMKDTEYLDTRGWIVKINISINLRSAVYVPVWAPVCMQSLREACTCQNIWISEKLRTTFGPISCPTFGKTNWNLFQNSRSKFRLI